MGQDASTNIMEEEEEENIIPASNQATTFSPTNRTLNRVTVEDVDEEDQEKVEIMPFLLQKLYIPDHLANPYLMLGWRKNHMRLQT